MNDLKPENLKDFVALLAEGVDRNPMTTYPAQPKKLVALLAEGVDRNKRL